MSRSDSAGSSSSSATEPEPGPESPNAETTASFDRDPGDQGKFGECVLYALSNVVAHMVGFKYDIWLPNECIRSVLDSETTKKGSLLYECHIHGTTVEKAVKAFNEGGTPRFKDKETGRVYGIQLTYLKIPYEKLLMLLKLSTGQCVAVCSMLPDSTSSSNDS